MKTRVGEQEGKTDRQAERTAAADTVGRRATRREGAER